MSLLFASVYQKRVLFLVEMVKSEIEKVGDACLSPAKWEVFLEIKINEKEAKNALSKKARQAEKLIKDTKQTQKTLKKAGTLLDKIKKIPVIGKIADDIATSIELIKDFVNGRYHRVPTGVIISTLAGVLYLVSPIDLIPDFIIGIGWIDDFTVFRLAQTLFLSRELKKYRDWKKITGNL